MQIAKWVSLRVWALLSSVSVVFCLLPSAPRHLQSERLPPQWNYLWVGGCGKRSKTPTTSHHNDFIVMIPWKPQAKTPWSIKKCLSVHCKFCWRFDLFPFSLSFNSCTLKAGKSAVETDTQLLKNCCKTPISFHYIFPKCSTVTQIDQLVSESIPNSSTGWSILGQGTEVQAQPDAWACVCLCVWMLVLCVIGWKWDL